MVIIILIAIIINRANEIENFEEIDKLKCLPNLNRIVLQGKLI